MMRSLYIALSAIALAACNPTSKPQENNPPSAALYSELSRAQSIPVGDPRCSNGGESIAVGFDHNNNSVLDANEVDKSYTICNGIDGQDGLDGQPAAEKILTIQEFSGVSSACSSLRGHLVSHGVDANGDGLLNSADADKKQYLLCEKSRLLQSRTCSITASVYNSDTQTSSTYGVTYRLDEFRDNEIAVYGAVLGAGAEISKSTYWSPYLSSQLANWRTAVVVVYLDVVGSQNGGRWVLKIDRDSELIEALPTSTAGASAAFVYEDSDLSSMPNISVTFDVFDLLNNCVFSALP